jgi:hypothetical protein
MRNIIAAMALLCVCASSAEARAHRYHHHHYSHGYSHAGRPAAWCGWCARRSAEIPVPSTTLRATGPTTAPTREDRPLALSLSGPITSAESSAKRMDGGLSRAATMDMAFARARGRCRVPSLSGRPTPASELASSPADRTEAKPISRDDQRPKCPSDRSDAGALFRKLATRMRVSAGLMEVL